MATNAEEIKKASGDTEEASKMRQEELRGLMQRVVKLESGQKATLEKLEVHIEGTKARERSNAAYRTTIIQLLQVLQTAATTPDKLQVPALTAETAVPKLPAEHLPTAAPSGLDQVLVSVRVIIDLSATVYDTNGARFKDINLTLSAQHCKTVSKLDAKASLATVPGLLEELSTDPTDLKDLRRASSLTLYEPQSDQPFGKSIVLTRANDDIYHAWFQRNVTASGAEPHVCFKMSVMHMDDEQEIREALKEGMDIMSGVERAQNKKARYFLGVYQSKEHVSAA